MPSDTARVLKSMMAYYSLMPKRYRDAIREVLAENEQLRAEVDRLEERIADFEKNWVLLGGDDDE